MHQLFRSEEIQNNYYLKYDKRFFFHITFALISFLVMSALWIISGDDNSVLLDILTIIIGLFVWLGLVLRIFVCPSSMKIENEKLFVKRFVGSDSDYNLSEFSEVSYSFWYSILLSRSGWLRFKSDPNKGIFISDIFFENLGSFLKLMEERGIKIERRLIEK